MTRPRWTIARLMGVVVLTGFGFAALRNANELWASATFMVAVAATLVALVGAFARQGKARTNWAGYAVFSLASILLWQANAPIPHAGGLMAGSLGGNSMGYGLAPGFSRQATPMGSFITEPLFQRWQSSICPGAPQYWGGLLAYEQTCRSLETILFGLIGAGLCRLAAPKETSQISSEIG